MSDVPEKAQVVVIGGGIVGNSLVYHLALQGWKEVVQVDKGPFPNPGGSTGHASNFIFPVDHSKEMTLVTLDSVEQYKELGVFTQSGGVELARTETRMEELRRRMASANAWGIESYLITPEEVKELVPYVDTDIILGAFYTPSVGVVDSLRAGTLMREKAMELGSLTISPNTEVTGLDVVDGRIHTVHTTRGSIQADIVMIACGVWSPRIAEMAGATIPLTPAVHQMISVAPVPLFEETTIEIEYPIVRDMDTSVTNVRMVRVWKSALTPTVPFLWMPMTSPPLKNQPSPPPNCPSPMKTSNPSWNRPSNSCPTSSATKASPSTTPSTASSP
jgi:glycine/D-amino acid oxidase-like deaminating enzyme